MCFKNAKKCSFISEENKSIREGKKCEQTPKIRKRQNISSLIFLRYSRNKYL